MSEIEIGRLLRSSTTGCVVGCRVSQLTAPAFGGLVRIPLDRHYQVYGLIYDTGHRRGCVRGGHPR
jgi:hypothetical protein